MKRILLLLLLLPAMVTNAQSSYGAPPKKGPSKSSKYSNLPSGYSRVGSSQLYCKQTTDAIDFIGYYDGYYYSSTYNDVGYKLAVKVGQSTAARVNCVNGTTNNGITVVPSVEQQGDLARICYTVTNTNKSDVIISLGTHADVMIGENDHAPISRRIDTMGQTYGLTMMDGDGAQLCVLFGSGLAGVTAVSDFWFGFFNQNGSASQMVGNYATNSSYFMVENGSYDSGMGWCWKSQTVAAGSTLVFSYLIGVGEVNLEPNSSFEVTPDDTEGWNDLNRPHRLTLEGTYESPAGLDGVIDYAVEGSEEWTALTDVLASGDTFTASLVAIFDPSRSVHTIRLRTRDLVGNTTFLQPIEYKDVSFHPVGGIMDLTYTGEPLVQESLTCDLEAEEYVAGNYSNNVNVGVASFTVEGVFPKTIGRKSYSFKILPQHLSGELVLSETEFVYSGSTFTPDWQFSNEGYSELKAGVDYTAVWSNNKLPGTGTLTVTGKNNYTSTLTANINIDKAPFRDDLYTLTLPNEDITYDGQSHGATVTKAEGVGKATITYQNEGESQATTTKPKTAGYYTIYLEFADGTLYHGMARTQVGTFSIYQLSAEEWSTIQSISSQLSAMGWSQPWDISQGVRSVPTLQGLTVKKGHVTSLNLAGQNLTGQFPNTILSLPELKQLNLSRNQLSGNIGTVSVPSTNHSLQELNISNNQLSGNIGLFANRFPNLTTLDASNNCLEDVYPMIPATVTSLNISKQTISRVVPLNLGNLSEDYLMTNVPSILLYDHTNRTYRQNISMYCSTPDNSWGVTMAYQDGQLSMPYISGQNTYYGESGDILNVAVLLSNGTREGSTFRISLGFDEGDGNFDGQVNVLDLQTDIIYIMEKYKTRPYNFTAANLWNDNLINVQDVIRLVDLLMNVEPAESASNARRKVQDLETNADASIFIQNGQVLLNSIEPVAALDLFLNNASSIEVDDLERMGLAVTTKKASDGLHIIAYSMNGACIPSGISVIGTIDTNAATVRSAMLSDSEANPISVSLDDVITGIEFVETTGDDVHKAIYDLQGRKVNTMSNKGIYIKNGRKIAK